MGYIFFASRKIYNAYNRRDNREVIIMLNKIMNWIGLGLSAIVFTIALVSVIIGFFGFPIVIDWLGYEYGMTNGQVLIAMIALFITLLVSGFAVQYFDYATDKK